MIILIWGNIWHLSAGKKSTSSFTIPLSWFFITKILRNCFSYFGHAWVCTLKVLLSIYRKLSVLSAGKNRLHPPCFCEDWLSAFWSLNREPEFCQIWDWWWNANNNISFHSRLFPRKTNKIFQKIQKHFETNLGPFFSNLVKTIFLWKRGLCQFLNVPIMYFTT